MFVVCITHAAVFDATRLVCGAGACVTVVCPSVRLSVPSIDICRLPQPGRGQ